MPRHKPGKRKFRYTGLIILALFLGLVLLGADIEPFDSINLGAPIWIALALLYLGGRLWRGVGKGDRCLGSSVLLLCYAALAVLLFRPLWAGPPTGAANGKLVRIVSFNINKDNPDGVAVARWLDRQAPDFIVLLEARDRAEIVASLLKDAYPYQYDCRGDGRCSTVILSQTAARSVEHYARGDSENRRTISALTARFDHAGVPLFITAAHMPRPWPFGLQGSRTRELAAVAGRPQGVHLVAGDFNNVPWTFAMNRMAADMDIRLMSRAVRSWPTALGWAAPLPIDNIYGRGCLRLVSVKRGPNLGSDHYPLVMTARIGGCNA